MKTKLKEFVQHLYPQVGNEDKAEGYIDEALPSIGLIVMYFNSLERLLDSILCENFTERSESTGLIVLNKINYVAKVDLLKRFCDDFHFCLRSFKSTQKPGVIRFTLTANKISGVDQKKIFKAFVLIYKGIRIEKTDIDSYQG